MTPTEQDKMSDIDKLEKRLAEWAYRVSIGDLMPDTLVKGVVELITKYGDKRELDGRMDELKKIEIGGDNIWTVDSGTDTAMLIDERIAELKAEQEEV